MKCWRCGCDRDAKARHFDVDVCESCRAGHARFAALARRRPHLLELSGPARECVVAWECGRLAFSRVLRPLGVHVTWRGFEPVVRVVERREDAI